MKEFITIRGAREHNLKDINLDLPRNKLIVFTGLSGSGKSSLAFDTIFAEGQRRYVESLSAYARQFLGGMKKPDVDEIDGLSPAISIDQKAHSANPRSSVATITEIYDYLRVLYARVGRPRCPNCQIDIGKMTTDEMAAKIFQEFGDKFKPEDQAIILSPIVRGRKGEYHQLLYDVYNSGYAEARVDGKFKKLKNTIVLNRHDKHNIDVVVDRLAINDLNYTKQRLSEAIENAVDLSNGLCAVIYPDQTEQVFSGEYSCPDCGFSFPEIEPRLFSFNSPYGYCQSCTGLGTKELFSAEVCPVCAGKRLNAAALSVLVNKKNIYEVTVMTIAEAREFFDKLYQGSVLTKDQTEIAEAVLKEIINRLQFMLDVGLHYLTLNRSAGTLSGGESQRIRLASQVGTRLVGALYVLDEPTIGLHQRDNERLLNTLTNLRDIGNTIIVVEHDEDTILSSDWVVDIGPGAGVNGGKIVASESTKDFLQNKNSITAKYLRGEEKIEIPENRRRVDNSGPKIKITGAKENNLKNLTVEFPLRRFVCVTGVSGSGKSTLVNDILYTAVYNRLNRTKHPVGKHTNIYGTEYLDKCLLIDQGAIGRSSRSNPATYTKVFDDVRDLFAETTEAKIRGYHKGRFSFNQPAGGRCKHCEGKGFLSIEMHFLPEVQIICPVCKSKRFDRETLEVHYNKKNIADVLEMTILEAD